MRTVPFFNYQFFSQNFGKQLNQVFNDVLSRGAFILQSDLEIFQQRICDYLNVKHAIGVGNCTDGLQLALMAAGIGPGDEVIFPSHTFVATAAAIHYTGATPVPVECGVDHMIDAVSIKQAITEKTKAIMPVQLNGRTCAMDAIKTIAATHDLIIIEDAAQALGSKFKNQCAGTFGLAASFSFYPAKVLPCLGDGGIVVTNDDDLAEKIYALHEHGRNKSGEMTGWGLNSRLDNLQAAFLNFFLSIYDEEIIQKRRQLAEIYHQRLTGCPQLILPPEPSAEDDHFDIYQNYEIECKHRDALQAHLQQEGIGTLQQWSGKAVHQWPSLGFNVTLPFTEQMTTQYLLLPMNISLIAADVHYVCDKILSFYEVEHASVNEHAESLSVEEMG